MTKPGCLVSLFRFVQQLSGCWGHGRNPNSPGPKLTVRWARQSCQQTVMTELSGPHGGQARGLGRPRVEPCSRGSPVQSDRASPLAFPTQASTAAEVVATTRTAGVTTAGITTTLTTEAATTGLPSNSRHPSSRHRRSHHPSSRHHHPATALLGTHRGPAATTRIATSPAQAPIPAPPLSAATALHR